MIKYLICPGWVTSKMDNDRHYISEHQLISLYKVNPLECRIMPKDDRGFKVDDSLIILSPDYSGKYIIPQKKNIT